MLNPVFTDPNNALLVDRLNKVAADLRSVSFPTEEEYQAAVYSAVNAVLSLGDRMHPVTLPIPEGPAIVGDISTNLNQVNSDVNDLVNEIGRVESITGSLYNQTAASQNELRQKIREGVYTSSKRTYIEEFINSNQIASTTATIDNAAGVAMSSLISESQLTFTAVVGQNSVGTLDAGSDINSLLDNDPNTLISFSGSSIEILFSSSNAVILNRLSLELDTYDPLELVTFTTSPDGSLVEDVLFDLGQPNILIDALSGKFTGAVILDFPPRQSKTVRLVLTDRTGTNNISIRNVKFWSRRYTASAQLASNQIDSPSNKILFETETVAPDPFVSITHQISYDSVQYTSVDPGLITLTSSPFWYRALFTRNESQFSSAATSSASLDPKQSSGYTLVSSTSIPKGNDITERNLTFNSVTGPIAFREAPIPNTIVVQQGAVVLRLGTDYTFTNNTLVLNSSGSISVSYQTSSAGVSSLPQREEYYSPLLYSVRFTQR